jgi:hypothetical protein
MSLNVQKNMKELIELQVILNNRYTGYYHLIQDVFVQFVKKF